MPRRAKRRAARAGAREAGLSVALSCSPLWSMPVARSRQIYMRFDLVLPRLQSLALPRPAISSTRTPPVLRGVILGKSGCSPQEMYRACEKRLRLQTEPGAQRGREVRKKWACAS
jgi:hypothetical protein